MDRNDLLAVTRAEFLSAYSGVLADLIKRSADNLFGAAERTINSSEARQLLDARAVLTTQGDELRRQIASNMERLVNRSFQTAYSSFRPSFSAAFKVDALSIVDASAFEDELLIDELTTQFRHAAEVQLRDLNIRIAVLFDQDNIMERENPFRPFLFTRSLSSAVEHLALSHELATTLIARLAHDATDNVVAIYTRLNELLIEHGVAATLQLKIVQPASHIPHASAPTEDAKVPNAKAESMPTTESARSNSSGVAPQPRSTGNQGGSAAASGSKRRVEDLIEKVQQTAQISAGAGQVSAQQSGLDNDFPESGDSGGAVSTSSQGWLGGVQKVGKAIRSMFMRHDGDDDETDFGPNDAASYQPVPLRQASPQLMQSVSALLETNVGNAAVFDAGQPIRNLIMESRSSLSSMTDDVDEQMTIDIVAMLFEFILRDPQVPAEIRAQLGRLQFLVLKVALRDPSLFTQKYHPARMLVNRIGSVSLALKQIDPSGERITQEICRIIEALLADPSEDIARFTTMLDEFDSFIARELRAADKQVEHTVVLMEDAETRTLEFARLMATIGEALSGLTIDPYLSDFFVNTWSRVLERAYHEKDILADSYRALIGEIIWSIAPKIEKQERAQLLKMIPSLLETLRSGLNLSHWQSSQKQELLNWLISAHTQALRAHSVPAPVPSLDDIQERFAIVTGVANPNESSASHVIQSSMETKFFSEVIQELEDSLSSLESMIDIDEELPASVLAPERSFDEQVIENLRCGVAVEIWISSDPALAKLNWISPKSHHLTMTIEGQNKPVVVSVKMFHRLLATGRARFLETNPLFERAVEGLFETADQMDRA